MDNPPANYHAEFLKSPHHAWLGLITLGLGFLSAQALGLVLGATGYALGWIYLPDMPFFRRWVERRREAVRKAAAQAQLEEFNRRRQALLQELYPQRREKYLALASVCQDIEASGSDNPLSTADPAADPRLRKLDELMWTFLRMLSLEQSLDNFLKKEQRENLSARVGEAEQSVEQLSAEIEALKKPGPSAALDAKQRLRDSRMELLDVLRKRLQRVEQAQNNLALVASEQERLDQQIKLIRADAVAIKNTEALTARIDATVENLDHTNKWLSELDQFKELVGDLPPADMRMGYRTEERPTVINDTPPRERTKIRYN